MQSHLYESRNTLEIQEGMSILHFGEMLRIDKCHILTEPKYPY